MTFLDIVIAVLFFWLAFSVSYLSMSLQRHYDWHRARGEHPTHRAR